MSTVVLLPNTKQLILSVLLLLFSLSQSSGKWQGRLVGRDCVWLFWRGQPENSSASSCLCFIYLCFVPLLLRVNREGAVLPQTWMWTWLTPYALHSCVFPFSSPDAPLLCSYPCLIYMFYQHRYTPLDIQLTCPPKYFSLLPKTCALLKMVLLSIGKCREEYFAGSLLKQVPFNIRVTFSKTQSLALLAQNVVLRKYLCQPFASCQFSGEGEDWQQDTCSWLSFHAAVTVRNSHMQEMLLNILQLQVEQGQLLQRAAILAVLIEIHIAVFQTSAFRPQTSDFTFLCLLICTIITSLW